MPLQDLADQQITRLRAFLEFPGHALCCLRHDPDFKHGVRRILLGLHDEKDSPHLMVYTKAAFAGADAFCRSLLEEVVAGNETHRPDAEARGVQLPRPPADGLPAVIRLGTYLAALAACLPDWVGSFVVLLDPERVSDGKEFARTLVALAEWVKPPRVKLLVFDNRKKPALPDVAALSRRAFVLDFHLGPEQIEAQVARDLQGGRLSWPERRQYLGMAGAFASARGEIAKAVQLQTQAAGLAALGGTPAEQAGAWYNLGNTHLKGNQLADAEGCLCQAASVCLAHDLRPLLAMVLTNLGVTLHRAGRTDEALQALDAARRTFAAVDNRSGEAHALDTRAAVLYAAGRRDEAEKAYLEELAVIDAITSPTFAELRASGREDVLGKLGRFYEATRQTDKLKALQRNGGAAP